MTITIKEFANELNISQTELLEKFLHSGIKKDASDIVSNDDKATLTAFLGGEDASKPKKLSLGKKKESISKIVEEDSKTTTLDGGKIKVEIKRKKTLVRDHGSLEDEISYIDDNDTENQPTTVNVSNTSSLSTQSGKNIQSSEVATETIIENDENNAEHEKISRNRKYRNKIMK